MSEPTTKAAAPLTDDLENGRVFHLVKTGKPYWAVQSRAHVTMKLKRVFPRMDKGSQGVHLIADTKEVCRDLLWFLERYPMGISTADQQALEVGSSAHIDQQIQVGNLLRQGPSLKFELAIPARPYQMAAAEIALHVGGLLVADDMGLGKTCTGICVITDPRARPAIVVTLAHLPKQWERELKKFAPGLAVHVAKKSSPYRIEKLDVLVLSYHKLAGWAETLVESGYFRGIVYDEIQELRHDGSQKSRAAKHLSAAMAVRVGLSGTPVYNYGDEMFSVLECVRPGALGDREEFLREWCRGGGSVIEPKAFGIHLRQEGLMVRRTREDVGRELPPITRVPHYIESDHAAYSEIETKCAALARFILQTEHAGSKKAEVMQASSELSWMLRQATGVAKASYVAAFVRLLVEGGEKVLLYGWHRAVYAIWEDALKDLGIVFFTGEETEKQKDESKRQFLEGDAKVLAMSLRAGAGLDGLQFGCATVVFGELDWSPGVLEQAECRVARDGQTRPVMVYYLLREDGSDPVMSEVLGLKRAQSENIRNPNAELTEKAGEDAERLKKLAAGWLKQRKIEDPQ